MANATCGYIYVLTNEAMPGVVKIGMTNGNPEKRAEQLSQRTSTPAAFDVYAIFPVKDARRAESQVHGALDEFRLSHKREFFRIVADDAVRRIEDALKDEADFALLARKKQADRILRASAIMEKKRKYALAGRRDPNKLPYLRKLMAEFDTKNQWNRKSHV